MSSLFTSLSTHVLDTALGRPAVGMPVRLDAATPDGWTRLAATRTDRDGRAREAFAESLTAALRVSAASNDGAPTGGAGGLYRLVFDTAAYYADHGIKDYFHPEVVVCFTIAEPGTHYHVPLLLSPFGYSTYRGS